ncbi:rRNA-processing protein-like protein [Hapsidospora chrysogenum ATCC 11550]|uniref:rRNA-processing protein n=1 Tax=Hapsidospora chrysogenum (strain ATCC 11550 / CBS 779.69 / DSM 880 / IAM 14645 / JCM 23072 / IMI 49137) TaxID=857340 RepID=A0A086TF45_HAPC1|nr:rRNA-processing protein-like protein [Hapsidospora chrysogenum ATCC 11550]
MPAELPMSEVTNESSSVAAPGRPSKPLGFRKNGKQWHPPKKAFRPAAGLKSYEKRTQERALLAQVKAKEKEMKEEKEQERKDKIAAIKEKRARKEEKERYEEMAAKMHRKRVERLKRKEKRNKLINS